MGGMDKVSSGLRDLVTTTFEITRSFWLKLLKSL
jgi:hypothetical protein